MILDIVHIRFEIRSQQFFNFIQILKFQQVMESQDVYCDMPECPHLRPSISSEDFDGIDLQEKFSLSQIETQAQSTDNFHEEFTEEENEPISKGKRSFHQICTSNKPSFQYYIERPEKRQMYVNVSDPQKKSTVELDFQELTCFTIYFLIFSNSQFIINSPMRKKQANLYVPDKKYRDSPFLTKEQIKDFESQFTLFNREINLLKLKQAMINQNYHHSSKSVFNFVENLSQETPSIDFNQYLKKLTQNLDNLNQGQLIAQMLDQQGKGQVSKQSLKQILEEALGREILQQQMSDIMVKLFDSNSEKISPDVIKKWLTQNFKIPSDLRVLSGDLSFIFHSSGQF